VDVLVKQPGQDACLVSASRWTCEKLKSMGNSSSVQMRKGQSAPLPPLRIPRSWKLAAGILRGRRLDPLEYQKQIRKQWERPSDVTSP
jgi:hypothetical protein